MSTSGSSTTPTGSRASASAWIWRGSTASRFGIGSVCGYGRVDPAELPHILAVHRDCAAALRR